MSEQGHSEQDEQVELVLRHHLPVPLDRSDTVLCLCDLRRTYVGPIGQRMHVVVELRKAGLLRD
jgi:hypothetical protein